MYQVSVNGVNHYVEHLNYVKKKVQTGCYVQTTKEKAEAVVVDNILCRLPYSEKLKDKPVAYINEVDSGELFNKLLREKKELEDELVLTQLAITDFMEGEDSMTQIYYSLVKKGIKKIEDVPEKIQNEIKEMLEQRK